jgi:hypothetical protein
MARYASVASFGDDIHFAKELGFYGFVVNEMLALHHGSGVLNTSRC